MEQRVKDILSESLETKGLSISEFVNESEHGFQCKGMMFKRGTWEFILPIEYKYIILKKNGVPEKRISKYKTNIIPSFCPICGKKRKK